LARFKAVEDDLQLLSRALVDVVQTLNSAPKKHSG